MSKVYAVVDSNGILAAFPWQDEARNYLKHVVKDENYNRDCILDNLGLNPYPEDYYQMLNDSHYVRDGDFLSLVTLTYINRSK